MKYVGRVLTMMAVSLLAVGAHIAAAQESVLYGGFGGAYVADGQYPASNLAFDTSGNLYGTTLEGGANNAGAVFELSPVAGGGWTETTLYSFGATTADGTRPQGGVAIDAQGNLYGTAVGGVNAFGLVYELVKPSAGGVWTEQVLYSFIETTYDASQPFAGLILDAEGNLYGTTSEGGQYLGGTVFELVKPSAGGVWTENILFSLGGTSGDGYHPEGSLIFDAQGNLYLTTASGGGTECECGTVIELLKPTAGGPWTENVLHSFTGFAFLPNDGANPQAALVLDAAGNVYGATPNGGSRSTGEEYGQGLVFELSPGAGGVWTESILHYFDTTSTTTNGNQPDGYYPAGSLILDAQGNLYGTTYNGGLALSGNDGGTIFELSPTGGGAWTENILWKFTGTPDGEQPAAGFISDAAGNLYSTSETGGVGQGGTVFEIAPPAVLVSPAPGSVVGNSDVQFTWTAGTGVTEYNLWLGLNGPGSSGLYTSGWLTAPATSTTVPSLPETGATVYARLFSMVGGKVHYNDYTYIESGTPATMITPASGSALGTSDVQFTWTAGTGVTEYLLWLGLSGPGSSSLYTSGWLTAPTNSTTVPSLPEKGATVYARLFSNVGGKVEYSDYTYTEAGTAATMITPGQGTQLGTSGVQFTWAPGTGVTEYQLWLGLSGPGSSSLYTSGWLAAPTTSTTVTSLPAHGAMVYARLYSNVGGTIEYNDYTYFEQ